MTEKLLSGKPLSQDEFEHIILYKDKYFDSFQQKAKEITEKVFGNEIFIRGLIEVSNVCRNDCLYCGIRRSNACVERYVLEDEEILKSCEDGYDAGFRTFVLQGGETDKNYASLVKKIKLKYPDCAVTLSLGEKTKEDYLELKSAGADRYLLRHETADNDHYEKLHPDEMSLKNRMECLKNLKKIGFQTGCGFMVGSPYQTTKTLAKDLQFIQEFKPHMVGIGPFIPQSDTPFKNEKAGSLELTLYLLSVLRIMLPKLLLPATTALESLSKGGREKGILHGANVVMPNISPMRARENYQLYNNKFCTDTPAKETLAILEKSLNKIGRMISYSRGDAVI